MKVSCYTSVTGIEKIQKLCVIVIYNHSQEPINQARINDSQINLIEGVTL